MSLRACVGSLFALLILLGPVAQAYYVPPAYSWARRIDEAGGTYATGYLGVQAGKGFISWSPERPSEDPAIPGTDSTTDASGAVSRLRYTYVDRTSTPVRIDEFVSEPLATELHLNASRLVQLDLQLTDREAGADAYSDVCNYYYSRIAGVGFGSGPDPELRIELLADDVLIAGSVSTQYVEYYWWNYERPPEPEGHATCTYRMPLEASVLPAGTVLKLRVLVIMEGSPFKWGLAGDHRSLLRLPVFSDDEWLLRDPKARPTSLGAGGEGEEAASGLLLLPVAGLALVRRRRATVLVAALVLASGCFGGGGPDAPAQSGPAGSLSYSIAPGSGNASTGAILGVVHDDLHVPLAGVHVSLLGTTNFTRSDNNGKFHLRNLPAATYTIRFDKEQYVSIQEEVVVKPGATSVLEVTLIPQDLSDPGARRHSHDYWSGETRKVVFEQALGFDCVGAAGQNCQPRTSFVIPSGAKGEFRTIRPGTERVEVTISWDAAMARSRVGLALQANNDPFWNATLFHPRESGKTYRVASTWEMTDVGHVPFSSWIFNLYGDPADEPTLGEGRAVTEAVQALSGQGFRVKVEIFKGAIPLEPAHPDPWGSKRVLPILQNQDMYLGATLAPQEQGKPNSPSFHEAERVVPSDTQWVQVNVTFSRETSPAWKPVLFYRPGGYQPGSNYDHTSPEYKRAPAPVKNGNKFTWALPLLEGEGDSVYALRSSWVFAVQADDGKAQWEDYWTHYSVANLASKISVAAYRDPMPPG